MDKGLKAARRYARAYHGYAGMTGVLDEARADIVFLGNILRESPVLLSFLGNSLVPSSIRQTILRDCFETRVNLATYRFIRLLEVRKRLPLLPAITHAFQEYDDCQRGIVHGTVSLPFAGEEASLRRVEERLFQKNPGVDIRLKAKEDPSLIGGFKIRIEDQVIDFSVAGRIHALKQQFG